MKSVLITGASGGIGTAITEAFLLDGYGVTMMARNPKTIGTSEKTFWFTGDVSSEADVQHAFEQHQKYFNESPSAVIHCAAVQLPIGATWKVSADEWEHALKINTMGSFLVTQVAIKNAIKYQSPCSIVLFSGGGAAYARPYFSAYGASKTAVLRLIETTAEELRLENLSELIQLNAISPGAVNTRMTQQIINSGIEQSGETAFQEAVRVEKGDGVSPEHAAELCLFLTDRNKNSGLSGRLIHVNEPYSNYAKKVGAIHESDKGLLRRIPIHES